MMGWGNKWRGIAVLALAWPLWAQAGAPAVTPRQQQLLAAERNSSPVYKAWRERFAVLISIEPELQRAVLFSRCAKPGGSRLLDPAYRAYAETVGGTYYRYLQRSGPASAMADTAKLWAIDQLTEAEYQRSLRWLTSDDTLPLRSARDVGTILSQYLRNSVDVSSGELNLAALLAMKATLARAGQLEPVVKAFAQVDPSKAALFASLATEIPLKDEQSRQWYEVAAWLNKAAKPVQTAYWAAVPQALIGAMAEDAFDDRLNQGTQALQAYERKGPVADAETHALNDEQRLGRTIAHYFGDPASDEIAQVPVDAHNWMWKQAQAYIAKHRAAMCSPR